MLQNVRRGSGYWKEYFIYDVSKALTPGVGTQAFDQSIVRIDSDADFELQKLTYVANSDRIKIKARDDSSGRYLIRDAVDIKSVAGRNTLPMGLSNAFIPFVFPIPYTFAAASNLTVEAQDYSGVANTLRLALHGCKIRQGQAPWEKSYRFRNPHIYGFSSAVTVAANSTASRTIEIDVDADFLCQKIVGIRTGSALVLIGESARGRDLMNSPVHLDNVIGNGAFPNILPAPRFIPRGSVITVDLTDLSGITNIIEVTLVGQKLYI